MSHNYIKIKVCKLRPKEMFSSAHQHFFFNEEIEEKKKATRCSSFIPLRDSCFNYTNLKKKYLKPLSVSLSSFLSFSKRKIEVTQYKLTYEKFRVNESWDTAQSNRHRDWIILQPKELPCSLWLVSTPYLSFSPSFVPLTSRGGGRKNLIWCLIKEKEK